MTTIADWKRPSEALPDVPPGKMREVLVARGDGMISETPIEEHGRSMVRLYVGVAHYCNGYIGMSEDDKEDWPTFIGFYELEDIHGGDSTLFNEIHPCFWAAMPEPPSAAGYAATEESGRDLSPVVERLREALASAKASLISKAESLEGAASRTSSHYRQIETLARAGAFREAAAMVAHSVEAN